ncbi:MAG: CDP-diacylglycerol--serine O-phosphatidyltransferase [Mycobacteriaceae bacterium]
MRLLPSAVTVLALCAGLSSIKFALDHQLGTALAMIGAASVLDALDGRIARLLDATSRIGAELDSLADAVSFGVAPALVLYVTVLGMTNGGWVVALVFVVSIVLRLARFNTLLDDESAPIYAKEFFTGVPSPAGGLLALLPVALLLQFGDGWWAGTAASSVWVLLVATAVISRVPTLSLKTARVPLRYASLLLVAVGTAFAGLIVFPYFFVIVLLLVYVAHIPYAIYRFRWLLAHPEEWDEEPLVRRPAIRRSQSTRRLGLRPARVRRRVPAGRRISHRPR